MKIAFISEHASPLAAAGGVDSGGQNVYVGQVARHLARAGHLVDIFTRRYRPDMENVVQLAPGVRVIHIPAGPPAFIAKEALLPYMREFAERLVGHCLRRSPYDVTHANFFMSGLAALRLRQAFGTPFAITFHALGKVRRQHQGQADAFPPERDLIEEHLAAKADRIIAECPQDRDDLIQLYQADAERIEVVPCGFDPDEFSPGRRSCRARLDIDPPPAEDEFIILQLGRLVPRKGIDNVIRALGLLRRRHGIVARLLVVGGDSPQPDPCLTPEIGRLAAIAEDEGVRRQVQFTGQRPRHRLRDYYCAADVFVSTPWYEPFGITPLEAMACGCPVIGSAVGGIKHSVADEVTGFLVPPKDPVALAACLARLHANPELGRAMGRAGIRRVRSAFTWNKVAGRLARIYADLVSPSHLPQHNVITVGAAS